MLRNKWIGLLALTALVGAAVGCDEKKAETATGLTYTQVERLARPAINEGVIVTNDLLNTFNQVAPSVDLSAAATSVRNEAVATMTALDNNAGRVNDRADALLPDMMRIDTTIAITPAQSAYAFGPQLIGATMMARPRNGRKLEDDVIDITLSVLTNGVVTTDNANFQGNAGNEANRPHSVLHGAAAYLSNATFPFLSRPQ